MKYNVPKIQPPLFTVVINGMKNELNEYELRQVQVDIHNGVLNYEDVYIIQKPDLYHVDVVRFHQDGRFDNKVVGIDLSYKLTKQLL